MDEPRWLDEREQRAWRSLMAMQDGLSEYIERQLRTRCGLSSADYQVLAHLSESADGRMRSMALGRATRWEKSRLSQHLTRMEKRGLVRRERCQSDQRGTVVIITEQGRTLIESAAPLHLADVRAVLIDHITPDQLDLLSELGDRVQARLAELEHRG
ncbi:MULTISPECIES: MarR family winged helix-turn-helix transcriptional regulator [unclassified Streptomyces]|uniref:MarR family winged helix-turn-helix transcriptional regulator n=1 Tax=unclassified Streptomyces TaxID=2593676 RepID=UPI0022591302|nr:MULTISPECIES: MarR family winged helix-turn-helix transcriptional regulator [unclassified Streptomyces]MCX4405982.1 MarR family winged helix-turn-helix transcriptional regulator [Streptomyces sp. NBC_01764]MCX5189494.1 MarR family winged helix-turn-helix transcriptional regulator [Streptomyces sp. NBC_00268]